jgi:hypothetical protein
MFRRQEHDTKRRTVAYQICEPISACTPCSLSVHILLRTVFCARRIVKEEPSQFLQGCLYQRSLLHLADHCLLIAEPCGTCTRDAGEEPYHACAACMSHQTNYCQSPCTVHPHRFSSRYHHESREQEVRNFAILLRFVHRWPTSTFLTGAGDSA